MNLCILALRFLKAILGFRRLGALALVALATILLASLPALAKHPFGGETPENALGAFLSGLGHPVIGVEHLAFVMTSGLLVTAVCGLRNLWRRCYVPDDPDCGFHLSSLSTIPL